jgi:membrane-associated protease RseP (regulator of RpoE activity)
VTARPIFLRALIVVFAIASATLLLPSGGAAQPAPGSAYIGASLQLLTDDLRRNLHYDGPNGLVVNQVLSGAPAATAGLQAGDVVTAVDGQAVTTLEAFVGLISSRPVGTSVTLKVWSAGTQRLITMTTVARPAGVAGGPVPVPAHVVARGNVKLLASWEDEYSDAWIVHARLLITNDTDVRLYPPDFVLVTSGGLGDSFKGMRNPAAGVSSAEDLAVCCADPKPLPADNQIVKVVNFVIPKAIANHRNWKITWRVQPPPPPE